MNTFCFVILGPTAVGKSSLLYRDLGDCPFHVISADSMEIYRGFDVATETPSSSNLARFPHTAVNELDPSEDYSVADFLDRADRALDRVAPTDRVPVVVGGTALYLKAFLYGLDDMPPANPDFRERLRERARGRDDDFLHRRLREVDPDAADAIHPNDQRRLIRALEIYHETGRTKTELTRGERTIREEISPVIVGLNRPREELDRRIRRRVEGMLSRGLVDEIAELRERFNPGQTIRQAIGYDAVCRHLDGRIDRGEVVESMVEKTRELVRKQMSWFRRFPVDGWYHPESDRGELIQTVESKLERTARA